MPTAEQEARLRALEVATEHRAHVGVIWYAHRADVPDLVVEAARAGRVFRDFGVLVLPATLSVSEWEHVIAARSATLSNRIATGLNGGSLHAEHQFGVSQDRETR